MPAPATSAPIDHAEDTLVGLAARYLVLEGQNRALDPVAHFHLSNGSWVERVNWWANPGFSGWDRSLALMANYRYRLESIEENHDSYGSSGQISTSSAVDRLLADRRPD